MSFLRQVKLEIVNILRSKFLLIIGILVLLSSIIIPVAMMLFPPKPDSNNYPGPIMYSERAMVAYAGKPMYPGGYDGQEPITIDGQVINPDNPTYWALLSIQQQQQMIREGSMTFANTGTSVIMLDIYDLQLDYYMHYAVHIPAYTSFDYNGNPLPDYRMDQMQWYGMNKLVEKYLYEHNDSDPAALYEAGNMSGSYYETQEAFNAKFINITPEAKLDAINAADEYLTKIYDMVDNNNFAVYIDLSKQQLMENVASNEDQIATLTQDMAAHPEQEEALRQQIKSLENWNKQITDKTIPMLQYRLVNNIIPNTNMWQNSAISDLENAQNFLVNYDLSLVSEEDFNKPDYQYLKDQYGTYNRYVAEMEAQKFEYENMEVVAQGSLDSNKPDMKYVQNSSRSQTINSLLYSVVVALFAVLLGGWIMGSEFQFDTIKLLLIRPKTRTKILMAKFTAALALCLGLYIVGTLLNVVANGICFGFSDFSFPNYTVAGEAGFFAFYIPEILACAVPIIFGFCVAFMLSMLVKNIAVSIAVPIICFVGCYLFTDALSKATRIMDWVAYTPVPYVQLYQFYLPYNTPMFSQYYMPSSPFIMPVKPSAAIQLMQKGMPLSTAYGIIMMLALSAVCVAVSILTFRKKDITT